MVEGKSLHEELVIFINTEEWTYAKTMPKWPHEYLVRQKVDEALFVKLAAFIRERGYEGKFYNKPITYYDHEDRVYWTMGAPIEETTIINRCLKEDSYESRFARFWPKLSSNASVPTVSSTSRRARYWSASRSNVRCGKTGTLRSLTTRLIEVSRPTLYEYI